MSNQLDFFENINRDPVWIASGDNTAVFQQLTSPTDAEVLIVAYLEKSHDIVAKLAACPVILIKPNLTSPEPPENGRTTNPIIVSSLIKALKSFGLKSSNIVVADSSVIGIDTREAARVTGILDVCHEHDVAFVDLNDGPFIEVRIAKPQKNPLIHIHQLALDQDVFKINCGKIKTTYGSPIGFCIKNLKGLITSEDKLKFHLDGVQDSLLDLHEAIEFNLNILEGFPASELGSPNECGLIGISNNDLFLDSIVAELVNIPCLEVPHLHQLLNRKGTWNAAELIKEPGLFKLQQTLPKLRYSAHGISDICYEYGMDIIDGKPCSSCLESFHKAIFKSFRNNLIPYDYPVVLGMYHADTDWEQYPKKSFIYIGECALQPYPVRKYLEEAYRLGKSSANILPHDHGFVVHGCPPTIDSIIDCFNILDMSARPLVISEDMFEKPEKVSGILRESSIISKAIEVLPINALITANEIVNIIKLMPTKEKLLECNSKEGTAQRDLISVAFQQPVIDGNIIRLYIRRGNIVPSNLISDSFLKANISGKIAEKNPLKLKIIEAMRYLATVSKCSIIDINEAEWRIAISICTPDAPDCDLKGDDSLWLKRRYVECPYKNNCNMQNDKSFK